MKIRLLILILILIVIAPPVARPQSTSTPIFNLPSASTIAGTNWVAVLQNPNATNGTKKATLNQIIAAISIALTNQTGTNLTTTNATKFVIFDQVNAGLWQFFGVEQGTNVVLYRNGSNIVINAQPGAGSGSIATNANQFLGVPLSIASGAQVTNPVVWGMTLKSNILHDGAFGSVVSFLNTSNLFGSWVQFSGMSPGAGKVMTSQDANGNAIWATPEVTTTILLAISNITVTASNSLRGQLIANDTTTSNGIVSLLVASDTTTSNGVIAQIMTASNTLDSVIRAKQHGTAALTNLAGTVGKNVTNVVSLSTSNATSKPLTNAYTSGVLTLFGLEAGANVTLTPNGSNLVVASTGGGGSGAYQTNAVAVATENTLNFTNGLDIFFIATDQVGTRVDLEGRIQNDAVSFAKMQNITSDRLVGRDTAGAGDPEEIALDGTSLEFSGSASIRRSALTGDVTASAGSATTTIAANAVTDTKLRDSSGLSVIGRSVNSAGDPADITASANGYVLYRTNNTLVWGRVIFTNDTFSNLAINSPADGDLLTFHGTTGLLTNRPATGGTGSTNPLAFAAGSIYITNSLQFVGSGMFLRSTNMWADGGVSSLYSNVFAANAGGLTNILVTNILDGQKIEGWIWASNGVTVGFPQFVAADYTDNAVVTPNTNCWTRFLITRLNTRTNIQVFTAGFELRWRDPNVQASTNFASRIITNWVNPNLTNIQAITWQAETRLIPTNNALSNIVVNFGVTNYVEIWFTNNLTFTNWTGLADDGHSASATYLLRPQLINRGVNWGKLGLSNPGYSVAIATNANNLLWTTLTNAKTYALTITRVRTNLFPTLTLWE